MNIPVIWIAILAAVTGAPAQRRQAQASGTVIVCLDNVINDPAIGQAEQLADRILRGASVFPEWRTAGGACGTRGDRAIRIDLLTHAPKDADPQALARSFPYEGVHIEVYLNRMSDAVGAIPYVLLAHVLAHEIAHIIEGVARHSETGVMKAQWSRADYDRMQRAPLTFTPEDIQLIQEGMTERAAGR